MYTALALATLVNSAFATAPIGANDGTYRDRSAMVRAFHSEAMVVTGGNFAFDMVPVQADGRRAFLMSDAFEDPDVAMGAGNGWLMVRDAAGNGTMVLVTNKTSLSDLEIALDGAPNIEAEFAIAYDEYGAHLVGVLDRHGQSAFERNVVQYRPAPSMVTESKAIFPNRPIVALPKRSFDVDPTTWSLDTDAQWGSSDGDGLRLDEYQRKEILSADLPDADGWRKFLSLGQPEQDENGWYLAEDGDTTQAVKSVGADMGRAWVQRSFDVQYTDDSGQWRSISGSMMKIESHIAGGLSAYGISQRSAK